jgi:glycosyltransferase involved in cell wall biosynthesis
MFNFPEAAAGTIKIDRTLGTMMTPARRRIALVGNFLPRRCGIATFTSHVYGALNEVIEAPQVDVYAMVDPGKRYLFPSAVTMSIDEQDRPAYRRAAQRIAAKNTDLIWIQHEYGIFGGPAGAYLLDLIGATSIPVVATLHTVLEVPNADQRRVLAQLARRASLLIVMADRARRLLETVYAVPRSKIAVIEHGVPERGYVPPAAARQCFGVEDRKTIMTFGLLSPDKGIETMIRALPRIIEKCPEAIYRVVGATHPHLLAREGERHRETLQTLAYDLGVGDHLRWENRFLDEEALLDRLATADVYVTPYRNPQQITSGALSYAAALGKPIVATPYVHATELLAGGRGVLVGFDDLEAIASAVGNLLSDQEQRGKLAARIYEHSRALTWRRMARRALDRFNALDIGIGSVRHGSYRSSIGDKVEVFA